MIGCLLCGALPVVAADNAVQLAPQGQSIALQPFLEVYVDESLSMDIEEAASPATASVWKPLLMSALPRDEGVTWLRFTLAPNAHPATWLLDLGPDVPGTPVLFDPVQNQLSGAMEWRENIPAQRNVLLLPPQTDTPLTCYIRLNGLPGPWFYPTVRTPQDAAANWSDLACTGAVLALAIVMLLCLLRWGTERGQWRVWTALFVAVALVQGILGLPPIMLGFSLSTLAAILAPGIALMLLPHVGRHLMNTPRLSRAIDVQLALLSLPGAALAILPLLPGFSWIERWIPAWPLACVIFLPTALGAWIMGLGGSRRFLLGCLFPTLFTVIALACLEFDIAPNLLASLPLWGVALGALVLAATKAPQPEAAETPATTPAQTPDPVINLEHPLDDMNLRIILPENVPPAPLMPEPMPESAESPDQELELRLRQPLDTLLREALALGNCSLPPAVRQYSENMLKATTQIANIICGRDSGNSLDDIEEEMSVFNLQSILRDAYDAVAPLAGNSSVALSWFVAPQIMNDYSGKPQSLRNVIEALLESSVRASLDGGVRLTARRSPEGTDPRRILITVTDSGKGVPPANRSTHAIIRAWELAAALGGYFGLEASPDGVTAVLSIRLDPAPGSEEDDKKLRPVVIASQVPETGKMLTTLLAGLPLRPMLAPDSKAVAQIQAREGAAMLIVTDDLAMPASADMVQGFARRAQQAGWKNPVVLAITPDRSQWDRLKPSGFTHAMVEEEIPELFADTVRELFETAYPEPASEESGPLEDSAEPDSANPDHDVIDLPPLEENVAGQPEAPAAPTSFPDEIEDTFVDIDSSLHLENLAEDASGNEPSSLSLEPENPAPQAPPSPEMAPVPPSPPSPPEPTFAPFSFQDEFSDWVGEPTPKSASPAGSAAASPPQPLTGAPEGTVGPATGGTLASQDATDCPAGEEEFTLGSAWDDADPEVTELVQRLDKAMSQAGAAFQARDCEAIAKSTSVVIESARNFGLHWLERMGACVKRAAEAQDLEALQDLLPELSAAVERNRIALTPKK